MANLKEIKRRIGSVKNNQKTTRAMKMVSAAKLRRAQEAILNARPYAQKIRSLVQRIAGTHRVDSALFGHGENVEKVLVVVLTSDKGLCGSFNASVGKEVVNYYTENKDKQEMDFVFIGRRGADYCKMRGVPVKETILNLAKEASYAYASTLSAKLLNSYLHEGYDQVRFVYNEFKSAISTILKNETVIPVEVSENAWEETEKDYAKDFIFEPGLEDILEELLQRNINVQIYRCLLDSLASEHGSRMNAMENATKNAGDMIRSLTLHYNNARQAAITTELTEITSGAEALNA